MLKVHQDFEPDWYMVKSSTKPIELLSILSHD